MTNFQDMKKTELRAACKEAGIPYSKLTVGGMRDTLTAHYAASATQEVKEDIAPATESASVEVKDPRDRAVCPECGSDELYAGESPEGIVINEDTVGGCHHCDWEYDMRKASKAATGKGLKIEKDREERNGVKRPSIGGACRMVWDYLDDVIAAGDTPTIKQVKVAAEEYGWNVNNASIEFYQWRKFNGIRGRQPKA